MCSPNGPKFSQIHAVFWKFLQNCMLVPSTPQRVDVPSYGEYWICPWISWLILHSFACNLHNRGHFCEMIKTRGSKPMLVKIFRWTCNFNQNIGLLPLVLIIIQKKVLLWTLTVKNSTALTLLMCFLFPLILFQCKYLHFTLGTVSMVFFNWHLKLNLREFLHTKTSFDNCTKKTKK